MHDVNVRNNDALLLHTLTFADRVGILPCLVVLAVILTAPNYVSPVEGCWERREARQEVETTLTALTAEEIK